MAFIDDWKAQFPKLWSVRFALLSALASAVEAGTNLYANNTPPLLVVAAFMASLGAAIARIVAQPSVTGNGQQ
jgi:hypothetical protein